MLRRRLLPAAARRARRRGTYSRARNHLAHRMCGANGDTRATRRRESAPPGRALPGVATGAVEWFGGLKSQYWTFFLTSAFFNFGLFIFFFLYNLYLLQLGFHENFLGLVSGVMTAGSLAGCIPAAAAVRRFGVRTDLARGLHRHRLHRRLARHRCSFAPALVALAFVAGFAGMHLGRRHLARDRAVDHRTQSLARLQPDLLIRRWDSAYWEDSSAVTCPGNSRASSRPTSTAIAPSLLFGCAMVLLALIPLSRLKIDAAPVSGAGVPPAEPSALAIFRRHDRVEPGNRRI